MLSYFPVSFKTKPFLRKYLISVYGQRPFFSHDDYFGMAVAAALDNPKKLHADKKQKDFDQLFKRFTADITIFLPVYWFKKSMYGVEIGQDKVCFINGLIEKRFEEELFMMANFYKNVLDVDMKDAINDFCNNHDIELDEDISFDGMKKKLYRNRHKKGLVKASKANINTEAVQISILL